MPWQQGVWDIAYEVDDEGQLWYDEVDLTVPRQSGKTTSMVPAATHRCTAWRSPTTGLVTPQSVVYTAQTRAAARLKWEEEHVKTLQNSALSSLFDVRLSNGGEAIQWHNDSRWGIEAVNDTAGHGGTNDLAFIDEAFAHQDATVEEALAPTMLTRDSSQIWVFSTAGTGKSKYLWRKVRDGRKMIESNDTDSRTAYFEWSAPDGAPYDDPEVWKACMPALGYTQRIEKVQRELARFKKGKEGVNGFRRSYLNQWYEIPILDDEEFSVINQAKWYAAADNRAFIEPSTATFAIDISPERSWTSIGVAGMSGTRNGHRHCEVVDRREGTDWVVTRVIELHKKHKPKRPWTIDSVGPASAIAPKLIAAKVPIEPMNGGDVTRACLAFYDDITNGLITHRGQSTLDAAAAGATRRKLGDNWAWDRRNSEVDISPLMAVTLAAYAHSLPLAGKTNVGIY